MSARAAKIERFTAAAFRGFRDSISFDLMSPVTILYAANGTGKTSFCQAAEWLLTGDIRGIDAADIRCKQAAKGQVALVSGAISVGQMHYPTLQRTRGSWTLGNEHRQNKILELLAPHILAERSLQHNIMIRRRREWLRGTHFFFSDSLSILVDRGPDSIDARRRIFADILGVLHLEEACQDLKVYAAALESSAWEAKQQYERTHGSLIGVEADLTHRYGAVDPHENIGPLLSDAELLLGRQAQLASSQEGGIDELLGLHVEAQMLLDRSRQRLQYVVSHWNEIPRLQIAIKTQQLNRVAYLKNLADTEVTRGAQANNDKQLITKLRRLETRQRSLSTLRDRLQTLTAELSEHLGQKWPVQPLEKVTSDVALEIGLRPRARATRRNRLQTLRQQFDVVSALYVELSSIDAGVAEATKHVEPPETVTLWELDLNAKATELSSLRSTYALVSEPFQQLQEAARALIEHLSSDHECPVCNHDWESPKALTAAMNAAIRNPAPSIGELQKRIRRLEQSVAALQKAISDHRRATEHLLSLRERSSIVREQTVMFDAAMEELLAANKGDNKGAEIDRAIERLALADLCERLDAVFGEVEGIAGSEVSRSAPLGKAIEQANASINDGLASLSKEREVLTEQQLQAQKAMDLLIGKVTQLKEALVEADARLKLHTGTLEEIHSNWREFEPKQTVSASLIERHQGALEERGKTLDAVKAKLEGASAIIAARRAASERDRLRGLVDSLKIRLTSLQKLIASATTLSRKLDEYSRGLAWKKLETLMPIAQTLFARMHANRVFDAIHPRSKTSPLDWLADTGTLQVNPQGVFSHGQRQDLALSLFLAKACMHGGTYILDEPVAHLDDLNRVAVLDIIRSIALAAGERLNLVITTNSLALKRHMAEKFALVPKIGGKNPLKIIELEGNPRVGVRMV